MLLERGGQRFALARLEAGIGSGWALHGADRAGNLDQRRVELARDGRTRDRRERQDVRGQALDADHREAWIAALISSTIASIARDAASFQCSSRYCGCLYAKRMPRELLTSAPRPPGRKPPAMSLA